VSASITGAVPEGPSGSPLRRIAWHWRHDEKIELWIGWWTLVVFYNLYGLLFFVITRTQPPPKPTLEPAEIVQWFGDRHDGLLEGYAIVFIAGGATAIMNATLAWTMRRMSVSRAFAYSYLVIYALSTFPGMLLMGVVCTVGAMRPDRDPQPQPVRLDGRRPQPRRDRCRAPRDGRHLRARGRRTGDEQRGPR